MIGAQYYEPIYYAIVSIGTFISLINVRRNSVRENNVFPLLLCCFLAFFIGLRPVSLKYFVDMYGVAMQFSLWAQNSIGFYVDVENLIYDNLRINMATLGFTYTSFFLLIAIIYFSGLYYISTRMFKTRKMLVFFVCLAAFSTFSFATNGIKAGSAASVFLIALALQHNNKRFLSIVVAILSIGFHHSMVLPVFAFLVSLSSSSIPQVLSKLVAESLANNSPKQAKMYFVWTLILLGFFGFLCVILYERNKGGARLADIFCVYR
jgi:hypothetical protein